MTHVDDNAITALTKYYSSLPGDKVLDLCGSWVSHMQKKVDMIGLGLNAYELKRNSSYSSFVQKDLNKDPTLPFEDNTFDICICTVSIDYLVHGRKIMSEVARVLKTGGSAHMAISNRCFPTKAIRRWLHSSEQERLRLVVDYFHFASPDDRIRLFKEPEIVDLVPHHRKMYADPLWVVHAELI